MKIQFKHQAFQRDAAQAVVNAFRGQPLQDFFVYRRDVGKGVLELEAQGFRNHDILLNDEELTRNIREVQISQELQPVNHVLRDGNGTLALSIEMETGTGKTYTYIKTMYELNKHYGWTKFIIVVPSVAIREGVIKSLETMADHFAEEYGERMQHFVYDSAHPKAIDQFASDPKIHVMVINTQAFNATGKDARRIFMKLEDFNYRRPIDILSETRPILIIDEPQSVLGTDKKNKTRQGLQQFNPLFSLLYSATHRKADVYNQVYRLDAIDAFNKRLVKKIEVIRIAVTSGTLANIQSREELEAGQAMQEGKTKTVKVKEAVASGVRYDLVGELVQRTGLKRSTIVAILTGIKPETFGMYRRNPEEFIIRAGNIINEQKAIAVIEHIAYHKMDQHYDASIFSEHELRGRIGIDAIQSERSLYDLVVVDSQGVEKRFAEELEREEEVEVYTKLPRGFYINTPVGKYNPDWAIVFREGAVKHIYFVAETKGSEDITQLRGVESAKIECAKRHFASISDSSVKFDVVKSYEKLKNIVTKD